MNTFIDLTGKRFGRLIVILRVDNNKHKQLRWLCRCGCGKEKIILGNHLKSGNTKSCGCLHNEGNNVSHGHTKNGKWSRAYHSWSGMIQRCTNINDKRYRDYGGRGIKVCKRWRNAFVDFLEDMGEPPGGYSIDRIDNNKGYKKPNCRWVTSKQNSRNRRDNLYFTYKNKTQLLMEWAEEYNILYVTLYARIFRSGWSIKKALTIPVKKRRK